MVLMALGAVAQAQHLVLKDASGRKIAPLRQTGRPATVYLFVLADCPIANAYAPEIRRIRAAYANKGVAFTLVMVDPTLPAAQATAHAKAFGLGAMPILLDPSHVF